MTHSSHVSALGGPDDRLRLARLLFDDLAAELDAALGSESSGVQRGEDIIAAAANVAREGDLGRAAFGGIDTPELRRLQQSFRSAGVVFHRAGMSVPAPEAFWAAGVDREAIARSLHADPTLVAVPAPHGLGERHWTELYRAAARQSASPLSLSSPLVIAAEVSQAFAELDRVPKGVRSVTGTGPEAKTVAWTLRLIPAAQTPARTGVSHAIGPHPTLPEMLMLQLLRLADGKEPIDRQSITWLHGTFEAARFAARSLFDDAERSVRVNSREVGNQGPHLGVRPPHH